MKRNDAQWKDSAAVMAGLFFIIDAAIPVGAAVLLWFL
jgi:hypothetical protein